MSVRACAITVAVVVRCTPVNRYRRSSDVAVCPENMTSDTKRAMPEIKLTNKESALKVYISIDEEHQLYHY